MNANRNIKLLLLKLNQQGHEASLIQEQKYSEKFNSIYSRYKLTFWKKVPKQNKKTGEVKLKSVPDTYEFSNAIDLLKYMAVKADERKTEGIC